MSKFKVGDTLKISEAGGSFRIDAIIEYIEDGDYINSHYKLQTVSLYGKLTGSFIGHIYNLSSHHFDNFSNDRSLNFSIELTPGSILKREFNNES